MIGPHFLSGHIFEVQMVGPSHVHAFIFLGKMGYFV